MHRGNRSRDLSHEHDWMPDLVDVEWDGELFVTWSCGWAEVVGSATSERWDETFYEYGAECAATKTATYTIEIEHEDRDIAPWSHVYEEVADQYADRVAEEATRLDPYDPMGGFSLGGEEVGLDEKYSVVYELDTVHVEEDWA